MKEYTKIIGAASVAGILIILAVGYFVLFEMNATLLSNQNEKFLSESRSKILIFNERLMNISNSFEAYSQLPAFRSIRFYTLTLNQHAVEENKRQLELFFLELHKSNDYLKKIRFIDLTGSEVISVDKDSIHYNLNHIDKYKNISHVLQANLKHDEFHIDIVNDDAGKPETMIWWYPVYVSASKKLGYLAFDVSAQLIEKEIKNISDSGVIYSAVTAGSDDLSQGNYLIISEQLPNDYLLQNNEWITSEDLTLSGLDWKINIIGDKHAYAEDINRIQSIVNYGLLPASLLISIILIFIYNKKVAADKHIHHLAYYDSLTGLVNRHQFDTILQTALTETREHREHHALLYIDLDQFKIVNDTCGHLAGDKLLEELAHHLKHNVRDSDTLGRLGGDEFAILLNNCPEDMAITISNKVLNAVSDFRFIWKNKSFGVGASIGIVFINQPDETTNNILRKADLACYMAKELGRNRTHIYTDDDQNIEERHGEMQWVSRIKRAIDEDLFFLVAQRILPLDDHPGDCKRYEILIRLNEEGTTISPDTFIPAAERYGLMTKIDKWVIKNTFIFMQKMFDSPIEENNNIVFSINVSGLTLGVKDFFPFIKEQISKYNIPPESICFEITETAAISSLSTALEFITSVKSLGCRLALDDFGSGLCSFSYLKTIPVDFLKIDGSFITRMIDNPLDMAIVVAIKQISLATKSKVIAEFVSSEEIKNKLIELDIDYAQGYAIAKPVPVNQLFTITDVNAIDRSA